MPSVSARTTRNSPIDSATSKRVSMLFPRKEKELAEKIQTHEKEAEKLPVAHPSIQAVDNVVGEVKNISNQAPPGSLLRLRSSIVIELDKLYPSEVATIIFNVTVLD
jgi:hypothetical protein